ncbi:MAG: CsbD family protein [Ilumatobacteraceae bacterium]
MDNTDQAKGKIKQAVGDLTDDRDLKREGKSDERAGKAKQAVSNVKEKADDLIDKTRDKVKGRD